MRIFFILALCLLIVLPSFANAKNPLSNYRWHTRLLLVFAQNDDMAVFRDQIKQFENYKQEAKDRDLYVVKILNNEKAVKLNDTNYPNKNLTSKYNEIYKKYNPNKQRFHIILVGKDGRIKGEWDDVVSSQEIFDLIDAMPMRKREVKGY